jgi:hypothetical protein
MSENIQNIVFEVLTQKCQNLWFLVDFWAFLPQSGKNVFSLHFFFIFSMHFQPYLCILIFQGQLKLVFINNLGIIFTIIGPNGPASVNKQAQLCAEGCEEGCR